MRSLETLCNNPHPLRLIVLFHNKASAIQDLYKMHAGYGIDYVITAAFTDNKDAVGMKFFTEHSMHKDRCRCRNKREAWKSIEEAKSPIPCIALDWALFQGKDPSQKRENYFRVLADTIDDIPFDLIVFSGFLRLVPEEFIHRFEGRMINVHPADLTVIDEITGKRRYVGQGRKALQKTIEDRQKFTCATVTFVEEGDPDEGEIIAQSQKCKIIPNEPAENLQNRLKIAADGQALGYALDKILSGEVSLPQKKKVNA